MIKQEKRPFGESMLEEAGSSIPCLEKFMCFIKFEATDTSAYPTKYNVPFSIHWTMSGA